jgi:2-dehydro-3-deoxyphosphogalactonate aldolase
MQLPDRSTGPGSLLRQHLAHCPLVAILRGVSPEQAVPVGQVLWHAGFSIIEVPLNSPSALRSIALLRQALPDALIGAGTVLTVADVHFVKDAGGQLVVAPNCNPTVIKAAVDAGMVCLPGVATPTEAFAALGAGAHGLKIFPAEMVPPAALRAMRAVLPADCVILPVGGIGLHNMAAYRQAGADGFGLGSALYRSDMTLRDIQSNAINLIAA